MFGLFKNKSLPCLPLVKSHSLERGSALPEEERTCHVSYFLEGNSS